MDSNSAAEQGGGTAITALHPDIIQTQILTRLDGPTLASATCASSQLQTLIGDDTLWRDICNSAWPSSSNSLVRRAISTFPSGHRSFYSDCFPTFDFNTGGVLHSHRQGQSVVPLSTPELISVVDIRFQNQLIFSKVAVTETRNSWFQSSPLRIDLLDPKEKVATPLKFDSEEESLIQFEEFMSISWILVDPTQKRAVNVSSLTPVLVQRHWLTGDLQVRCTTIMTGTSQGGDGSRELVQCKVEVTCGGKEGGELHVKEVSMWIEDMDEKILSGEESMVILQEAMKSVRRKRKTGEEIWKYGEFEVLVRERRLQKHRRERRVETVFTVAGFTIFFILWIFIYSMFSKKEY